MSLPRGVVDANAAYQRHMGNAWVGTSSAQATDAWRIRLEYWRRLRHLLDSAELSAGRLRQECLQAAGSILQLLAPGEESWPYPSASRVAELRLLVTRGEVGTAAAEAREIAGTLEVM